jgi:TolA-binding protein
VSRQDIKKGGLYMAGEESSCAEIQANIDDDLFQLRTLRIQKSRTKNAARAAQIQQQIEQLQQEIDVLVQKKQGLGCL